MFSRVQHCKEILLSGNKERFIEFTKTYRFYDIIDNAFYDNDFLKEFFCLDVDFFLYVMKSHSDLENSFPINDYIQKNNFIEHAKVFYTPQHNLIVDATPASLICFEQAITSIENDYFESLANFVVFLKSSKNPCDIKSFCNIIKKIPKVEFDPDIYGSEFLFCNIDIVKTLRKVIIFLEDTHIDVRNLLYFNNSFVYLIPLLKIVELMVPVYYDKDSPVYFQFSGEIMDFLIKKYDLSPQDVFTQIRFYPSVESIDYYYSKYESLPKDNWTFGVGAVVDDHLLPRMTVASYCALRKHKVKINGKIELRLSYDNFDDENINITIEECEMINFNDVESIVFPNMSEDVFLWFTKNQSKLIYDMLMLRYFKYELYQLTWLLNYRKSQNKKLSITMIIDFNFRILPDIEIVKIIKENIDSIDFYTFNFVFNFEKDSVFWKIIFGTFPNMIESVYDNISLFSELDQCVCDLVDREITIKVGDRTSLSFINYVRKNCPLIKLDFITQFRKIVLNIDCCDILNIMVDEFEDDLDLSTNIISMRFNTDTKKNIYHFSDDYVIDDTIFNHMVKNNMFSMWKLRFNVDDESDLECVRILAKQQKKAIIVCYFYVDETVIEFMKTNYPNFRIDYII